MWRLKVRRLNVELAGIPDEVRVNKCFGRTWKWKVPRSNLELQGSGPNLDLTGGWCFGRNWMLFWNWQGFVLNLEVEIYAWRVRRKSCLGGRAGFWSSEAHPRALFWAAAVLDLATCCRSAFKINDAHSIGMLCICVARIVKLCTRGFRVAPMAKCPFIFLRVLCICVSRMYGLPSVDS